MKERPSVLLVDMEFDYGIRAMGRSYGYYNMLLPLRELYPDAMFFDFLERIAEVGRERMNAELAELVERTRPEITIVSLFGDQMVPEVIRSLSKWTTTVGYFYDDVWRREYANEWARHFDLVTTPERAGLARFASDGHENAIHCAFAFNDTMYRRVAVPYEYDVSFIGGFHPYREWITNRVRQAGFSVGVFGPGWPAGKVSLEEMVRIFCASRINLNISNSAQWDLPYLLSSVTALKWTLKTNKRREQVKGRHFEIAGVGGFQLSFDVTGLDDYFAIGREIATYRNASDLMNKVRYYLANDAERQRIAEAGWIRANREHTARVRMTQLMVDVRARVPSLRANQPRN